MCVTQGHISYFILVSLRISHFTLLRICGVTLKYVSYSHSRFNILSEVFHPLFYLYIIIILRKINPKKWLSKILVRIWYATQITKQRLKGYHSTHYRLLLGGNFLYYYIDVFKGYYNCLRFVDFW